MDIQANYKAFVNVAENLYEKMKYYKGITDLVDSKRGSGSYTPGASSLDPALLER